jgi:hypothetical protein
MGCAMFTVIYGFIVLSCLIVSHGGSVSSVNFLLIGDWGLPGFNQSLIADHMGEWAAKEQLAFVVALGDNFYCKKASRFYHIPSKFSHSHLFCVHS